LYAAVEAAEGAGEITLSELTVHAWGDLYRFLNVETPGLVGELNARNAALVRRVAAIYALLDTKTVILTEHLDAAAALVQYSADSVRYLFRHASGDPDLERVVAACKASSEGLSRREVFALFGNHRSADQIAQLRARGVQMCQLQVRKEQTGGAPREVWTAS
ncbi:MAG: hypothetical protein IH965_09700, partial [Gemmatimonadetes bacterium]|nr:hypothetical protein [Gemmatimonadota bacterium]